MRGFFTALLAVGFLAAPFVGAKALTIEGSTRFQSVRVLLPPGQWEEVGTFAIPNPRFPNFPIAQQILVSRTGKVVDRVVRIWVQTKKLQQDWFTPYHPCDADGYYHSKVIDNSGNRLDCWHVRTLSLGQDGDTEPGNAALVKHGKKNGLFVPVVMLGARFARYASTSKRYYVEYLWTPDLLLPANTPAKVWLPADWTLEKVKADADKAAAVQVIVDWAKAWHDQMK